MNFGTRLKAARELNGFSGAALGKLLVKPVSRQTISHWEMGRFPPDVLYLRQLCVILNCSADHLILGMTKLSPKAAEIGAWFDALSKADKQRWTLILEAMRPPADQDHVQDVTPSRPISDFQKLK
jgi:transcriptional regulator with XRE-family HTH domain